MEKVNSLTVCRDNFKSQEEFERMVGEVVMTLLKNRQIAVVRYDEPGLGIVDIEFNPDEQAYGADYPVWLTCEEQETIYCERAHDEEEEE